MPGYRWQGARSVATLVVGSPAKHLEEATPVGFLIGTDEAGYGPNLGPLVISATLWQVPNQVRAEDLYRLLGEVIVCSGGRAAHNDPKCVAMADSKVLYRPGKGIGDLERGLLAALAVLGRHPTSWLEVWQSLAPESADTRHSIPWYADYDAPLPLKADPEDREPLAEAVSRVLATAGVRLVDIQSRAIFPQEFNQLVYRYGTKATALSQATLNLAARLIQPLEEGPISILCDKHGGRNRYGRLLTEHFPEWLIEVYGESRERSVYRFGPRKRRVEIRFQGKAESCLPVALASMASKYLRELAMRAFNAFWCQRVAGLRPTAGYPRDARRFKTTIAAAQAHLGIEEQALWRKK